MSRFERQGHRGARGHKPENTLVGFEYALDAGVDSIEVDLHLSRDGVPIVLHDPILSENLFSRVAGVESGPRPWVRQLSVVEIRQFRVDRNPDPIRFPQQNDVVTSRAAAFAASRGFDPLSPPTLADFFAFVGDRPLIFDLELKRIPFHPETIGDNFDGDRPALLEIAIVEAIHSAGVMHLCRLRSFDHRSMRAVKVLEPKLETALLLANTAPADLGTLARSVNAEWICPEYRFIDAALVRQAHAEGLKVLPWTVNDAASLRRLRDMGVDGATSDFPELFNG